MADPRGVGPRLHLARQGLSPSDEQRRRVRSALAARLAAEPAAEGAVQRPSAALARAATAGKSVLSRRLRRGLEAAGLVAAGFVLGIWFAAERQPGAAPASAPAAAERSRKSAAPPAAEALPVLARPSHEPAEASQRDDVGTASSAAPDQASQRASSAASTTASSASSDASNGPGRAAASSSLRGRGRSHARGAAGASAGDGFADELALLRRAERATRSGDGALARSLIAELDARFPKTALRQERAALLVLAACATGEPSAPSDARQFVQRHAQSVYLDRIRSACELEAEGASGSRAAPRAGSSAE